MSERFYWLAFSAFPGIGPVRFKLLLDFFGSAKKAFEASRKDLLSINLGERLTEKFDRFRHEFSPVVYAKRLKEEGVSFLILTDEKYPKLLKEISDPPFVLYVKGERPHSADSRRPEPMASDEASLEAWDINNKTIAVVGTRRITNYGREVTRFLVTELVNAGLTIVSGLAIGVDAASHEAAIAAGGKTIAVLGCGVDCCYPRANLPLYRKIIAGNGAVFSEMPLSHFATRGLFPARNRIISGLSLGVLVVEGASDSGALITASNAAEQGREVFAVPGPITSSYSQGPASLIKKGAKLVTQATDILEELDIRVKGKGSAPRVKRRGETEEEQKIVALLEHEDLHYDELVRRSGMAASTVGSLLSLLEMRGVVRDIGGGIFTSCK